MNTRNVDGLTFFRRETPAAQQAFGLYPINQKTLLDEAFAHLCLGVAGLYLLHHPALLVSDFYQKFSHVRIDKID